MGDFVMRMMEEEWDYGEGGQVWLNKTTLESFPASQDY